MECTVCSRSLADDVRVEAVRAATVPPPGGEGFSADDHVAIIQPVVLAFAQYLHERVHVSTTDRAARMPRGDSGRSLTIRRHGRHRSGRRCARGARRAGTESCVSDHRLNDVPRSSRDVRPGSGHAKRPIGPEPDRRCHSATVVSGSSLPGCTSLDHAWIGLDEESWSQSAADPVRRSRMGSSDRLAAAAASRGLKVEVRAFPDGTRPRTMLLLRSAATSHRSSSRSSSSLTKNRSWHSSAVRIDWTNSDSQ